MKIRSPTLLTACLLGSLCLLVAGCDMLGISGSSDGLTFVNRADRAFAPIVFDQKDMPLIDPRPFLTEEEFDERKIETGLTAVLDDTGGYGRGDDLHVILYARCDCDAGPASSILTCPRDAPFATGFNVSAIDLVQANYKVTVKGRAASGVPRRGLSPLVIMIDAESRNHKYDATSQPR